MDVLHQVRTRTTDAELHAVIAQLPKNTAKPCASKLARLRRLIDGSRCAPCTLAAVILGDVHTTSRWLQQAAGSDITCLTQALEAILAVLKHAFPLLTPPLRERYQRAWRQAYAAAREELAQQAEASRQAAAQLHVTKLEALTQAIRALAKGDMDRCLLVLLLRMAGRLSDELVGRLGDMAVYDGRGGACDAPGEEILQDFVFVDDGAEASYLAFRSSGESGPTQVRARLPEDVASEIKASLDLRRRSHLLVQRGGHPYRVHASFQKRMRCALHGALEAAGQASVSLADMLAIARSGDGVLEQKRAAVVAAAQ